MPHSSNQKNEEAIPCVYSDGKDRFVHNIENGTWIGYKYFSLKGKQELKITYRGNVQGNVAVSDQLHGRALAVLEVSPAEEWKETGLQVPFSKGKSAIYFYFTGEGSMDLLSFELI